MSTREQDREAALTVGQSHIVLFYNAADAYAVRVHREMELNAGEATLEGELVRSLVGTPKPGEEAAEKPKLHSVSSAEEAIKTDPRYLDHKRTLRDVVLEKNRAHTRMTGARLNVELATALLNSLRPVDALGADSAVIDGKVFIRG